MVTEKQMDAALAAFRAMSSSDEFYRTLRDDPEFREALEAAFARDVRDRMPPTLPPTSDPREMNPSLREIEKHSPTPHVPPKGVTNPEPQKKKLTPFGWV